MKDEIKERMRADALLVCYLCRGIDDGYRAKPEDGMHYGFGETPYKVPCLAAPIYAEIAHTEAPKLADLKGIAPGLTGDESSEDFVRRIRGEWDNKP